MKKQDELTEKMHSEFSVSDETDEMHTVWMVIEDLDNGLLTIKEALDDYGVTSEMIEKYRSSHDEIIDGDN